MLSSSEHRTSPKTDPNSRNKNNLNTKKIKIISCNISEHEVWEVQINNKNYKHYTNPWMLSKIQLNVQWATEEKKRENLKRLGVSINVNTTK